MSPTGANVYARKRTMNPVFSFAKFDQAPPKWRVTKREAKVA